MKTSKDDSLLFANMNRAKTYILIAILFNLNGIPLACEEVKEEDFKHVASEFQVLGTGFHREMRISSSFLPSCLEGCSVLIKWTIPSGIYVDPYQLHTSVLNKTVHFSSNVNIEQMAHHAEHFTLYSLASLQCSSSCSFSQSIQFHLRYHLPSNIESYTTVSLSSPVTYFSCDFTSMDVTDVSKCVWHSLPEHFQIQEMLVPIGELFHSTLVTTVTIAISFIGIASVAWFSTVK